MLSIYSRLESPILLRAMIWKRYKSYNAKGFPPKGKVFNNGILSKMRFTSWTKKVQKRKGSNFSSCLPKMRIQKTWSGREYWTESCLQSYPTQSTTVRCCHRQGRTETQHAPDGADRMPSMRQQHRLCMAGTDPWRRRILHTVSALYQVQLHLPRIQLSQLLFLIFTCMRQCAGTAFFKSHNLGNDGARLKNKLERATCISGA